MFVTEPNEIDGPRRVINFPTKQHWRQPSKMEWITSGRYGLRRFLVENNVKFVRGREHGLAQLEVVAHCPGQAASLYR